MHSSQRTVDFRCLAHLVLQASRRELEAAAARDERLEQEMAQLRILRSQDQASSEIHLVSLRCPEVFTPFPRPRQMGWSPEAWLVPICRSLHALIRLLCW